MSAGGIGELGSLVARIKADASKFTAELKAVNSEMSHTRSKAETEIGGIGRVFKNLEGPMKATISVVKSVGIAIAGLGAASAGLVYLTKHQAEFVDQIAKTSRRAGIAVETFQKLDYQFRLAGGNTSLLVKSLDFLNYNVGQLRAGSGALYTYLGRTNVALADQLRNATSTKAAWDLLAGAIRHARNAQEAMAIARAAFGRGGAQLVNMLREQTGALDEQAARAKSLGFVFSTDLARATEKLNDDMSTAGQVLHDNFARGILQATTGTSDFEKLLSDPSNLQSLRDFATDIGKVTGAVVNLVASLISGYDHLKRFISEVRRFSNKYLGAQTNDQYYQQTEATLTKQIASTTDPKRRAQLEKILRGVQDTAAAEYRQKLGDQPSASDLLSSLGLPTPASAAPAVPSDLQATLSGLGDAYSGGGLGGKATVDTQAQSLLQRIQRENSAVSLDPGQQLRVRAQQERDLVNQQITDEKDKARALKMIDDTLQKSLRSMEDKTQGDALKAFITRAKKQEQAGHSLVTSLKSQYKSLAESQISDVNATAAQRKKAHDWLLQQIKEEYDARKKLIQNAPGLTPKDRAAAMQELDAINAQNLKNLADKTRSVWTDTIDSIGNLGLETFGNIFSTWISGGKVAASQILTQFLKAFAQIEAKALAMDLYRSITSAGKSASTSIGSGAGSSTGSVVGMIVKGILGAVTHYGSGGHVTTPQLAIVGDRNEHIIPDDQLSPLGGSSFGRGNINVQVINQSSSAHVPAPQVHRNNNGDMVVQFMVADTFMRDMDNRGPMYQRLVAAGMLPYGGHLR